MKIKLAIQVPEKISQAIFGLPIVMSAEKGHGLTVVYCLSPYVGKDHVLHDVIRFDDWIADEAHYLYPTEWVCQTEDDDYYILTDEQYKKIKRKDLEVQYSKHYVL